MNESVEDLFIRELDLFVQMNELSKQKYKTVQWVSKERRQILNEIVRFAN